MTDLEAEVQQLLARKPTSVIRQLAAAAVAVVATVGAGYSLAWFLFTLLDWGRESFVGVLLGAPLAWFVYPVVAWRPFRFKHLAIAAGLLVFATVGTAALLYVFGQKGLTANPALDWVLSYAIAGVVVFEAATLVRNKDIGKPGA